MIAIQPKSRQILGVNQQAYQSLKASMSLKLRRQLIIAVCDSVALQEQLASQLEADLSQESWAADSFEGSVNTLPSVALDRLVFDPEDAHLPRQVAQWVRQTMLDDGALPQLQILGIEQMTHQPAIMQNHFLRSLEKVEALLPRLNTSLLIWVPWPWLRTIQASAPTFWKWRNGVFEFVSDPTPSSVWDDSLDLDLFEDEAAVPSADSLEHDSSYRDGQGGHLTPEDLIGDYVDSPTRPLASLYGDNGEGDRPVTLQTLTPDAVSLPLEEEPVVASPADASALPDAAPTAMTSEDVAATLEDAIGEEGAS
ncbi:MAG: hypothetical protein AAFU53_05835, partial [Cyanobacteria bacterium J06632_3]